MQFLFVFNLACCCADCSITVNFQFTISKWIFTDYNISLFDKRKVILVIKVSVSSEYHPAALGPKHGVIRHNGEIEHHLIHLGFTVAADAEELT